MACNCAPFLEKKVLHPEKVSTYTLLLSKYVVSAYLLASESTGTGFSKNPSSNCLLLIQVLKILNFNKNVMCRYYF